jgi:hypothetical protein
VKSNDTREKSVWTSWKLWLVPAMVVLVAIVALLGLSDIKKAIAFFYPMF